MRDSEKRSKLFEYFRNLCTPARFVFLQETHTVTNVKKKFNNYFQGQLCFSYSRTNSCWVARGYYEKKSFELLNQFYDKSKRVLIIEVKIENKVLLLINLYNANTENEELSTLSDLNNILEKINNINAKSIQFGGDFNL